MLDSLVRVSRRVGWMTDLLTPRLQSEWVAGGPLKQAQTAHFHWEPAKDAPSGPYLDHRASTHIYTTPHKQGVLLPFHTSPLLVNNPAYSTTDTSRSQHPKLPYRHLPYRSGDPWKGRGDSMRHWKCTTQQKDTCPRI